MNTPLSELIYQTQLEHEKEPASEQQTKVCLMLSAISDRAKATEADISALRLEVAALRAQLCVMHSSADVLLHNQAGFPYNTEQIQAAIATLSDLDAATKDLVAVGRGELEELRKDKERLDWLNKRARFSFSLEEVDPMDIYARPAREAIDSAATAKGRAL